MSLLYSLDFRNIRETQLTMHAEQQKQAADEQKARKKKKVIFEVKIE